MKVKQEDFRLHQCSNKEKPLIYSKDGQKYLWKSANLISNEILVFKTELEFQMLIEISKFIKRGSSFPN